MLIAIDGSTKATGWALGGREDGAPRSGVWTLPGSDEQVFDLTLARVTESLGDLCRLMKAQHVMIEAPLLLVDAEHSAHTAMALIQLTGAIRAVAKRCNAKVSLVAVSTVRKHFIGTGNLKRAAAKQAVMDRCKLLGWEHGGDDNRGDAMAVWAYGMALLYPSWAPKSTPLFGRAGA